MDGPGTGGQGGADDALLIQIAVRGFCPADAHRLVRQGHMEGIPVRLRIHRHRGNAHFLAGPDDPDRDLAPVGNENF